jgi:hypothetical protein
MNYQFTYFKLYYPDTITDDYCISISKLGSILETYNRLDEKERKILKIENFKEDLKHLNDENYFKHKIKYKLRTKKLKRILG